MIQTRPLESSERAAILSNFVEIQNPQEIATFCVDGRKGPRLNAAKKSIEGPYLQALGGSYHLVALNWLLNNGGTADYMQSAQQTFTTMQEKRMKIGVHRGHHGEGEKSDCGFADNLGKIIQTLNNNKDGIWQLITQAEESLSVKTAEWGALMKSIEDARIDTIPSGDVLIETAESKGADMQNLEGEHQEIAAVVNLKPNTTLNVDDNQQTQAFNLDLWRIIEQAEQLGMDESKATLLSLGLYVATEMVLVEQKNKPRLPIVINK